MHAICVFFPFKICPVIFFFPKLLLLNMRFSVCAISDPSLFIFSPVVYRGLAADTSRFFAIGDSCQDVIEPSKHSRESIMHELVGMKTAIAKSGREPVSHFIAHRN